MIQTQAIGKDFRDHKGRLVEAVKDVSISASDGEILGILGVNGAGKTTLLRVLSTVIKPTRGTATVAGHSILDDPAAVRASIGFLSTTTALYGRQTGFEVLRYFGQLYGIEGARLKERVEFVTETLRLDEFADRLCDKMSTGQKQRISIARAILHDPPVLFFDEPTAGLDVVTGQTILEFIETTRNRGKTVVFCTHIMSEAERLCDRIVVIHEGRVHGEGTVAELQQQTGQQTLERAFLQLVNYAPGEVVS